LLQALRQKGLDRSPTGGPSAAPADVGLEHDVHAQVLVIRKLSTGEYRLYSSKPHPRTGKRRNLGTFKTRAAAVKHERAVQFFKRRG
jgi:hypothetical protein